MMNTEKQIEIMFQDFKDSGVPLTFGKKQYAGLVGQSVSTVSGNIVSGRNISKYSKMGKSKNAQVLFNLRDVCEFIVNARVEVA